MRGGVGGFIRAPTPARTPGIVAESPKVATLRAQQRRVDDTSITVASRGRTTPGMSTGSPTLDAALDKLQRAAGTGLSTFVGTGSVPAAVGSGVGALFAPGTQFGPLVGRDVSQLAQLPVVVQPMQTMRNQAPAGYVLVRRKNSQTGQLEVFAVLESVARAMRLVSPRSKPPISASDWKKLKTAKRVETKAKKIAQTAGFVCRTSKR